MKPLGGMSRYKDQGEALGHTDTKGQGEKGTSEDTKTRGGDGEGGGKTKERYASKNE